MESSSVNPSNLTFIVRLMTDPQIILYKDGQPTQYSGERTYEKLEEFIETHSSEYARTQLPMAPSESEGGSVSRTRPNPEGRVMEVDEKELDVFTRQGPVLVDFYAPWCSQ
jgi:thioredoxin-like negative regulator of GroEL